MTARLSQRLEINDSGQIGHARRTGAELATQCGFNETQCSNVALVISELASNLVKHAGSGELILNARPIVSRTSAAGPTLDILSIDRGPGIVDVEQCLADGYSTYGSSGNGLGAVRRLSSACEIFSGAQRGTIVLSRFTAGSAAETRAIEVGGVSIAAPGETECGDAWATWVDRQKCTIVVADGLGHGPLAATAAHEAVGILVNHPQASPMEIVRLAHEALRATRGAALIVAELDAGSRKIHYAGVGNISACVRAGGRTQSMVSNNGTAGSLSPTIREFVYDIPSDAIVIFWSDGLTSQLKLDEYPGLSGFDSSVIAGVLYRDFKRGKDDATAVVVKIA